MSQWGMRRSVAALVVGSAVALLATACVPGADPTPSPTPTVQPTPLFATEEEALAAAEEVYLRYLDLLNTVGHDGGRDANRLHEVLGGELKDDTDNEFQMMLDSDSRVQGDIGLISLEVQQFSPRSVSAYACVSYADVYLVRADGTVKPLFTGDPTVPLQLEFTAEQSSALLVRQSRWDGQDFC